MKRNEQPKRLMIDEAVDIVRTVYRQAMKLNGDAAKNGYGPIVTDPVAWALYRAWRIADGKEKLEA